VLKNAQTPTSRVHALLGVVDLEDSIATKDLTAKLTKLLHTIQPLARTKKHN